MRVYAELRAFAVDDEIQLRPIDIPDHEAQGKTTQELLELAFRYGQNDFQPREFYSVSMFDVVVLGNGERWRCEMVGWSKCDT